MGPHWILELPHTGRCSGNRYKGEKNMRRNLVAAIGGLLAFGLAATAQAQEVDAIVKKLRDTNTITMGIRETLYPYGFLDNDKKPSGYSVEFCQRIIEDIKAEL